MACLPKRYTIAILSYFGFTLIMILQSNFTFAFLTTIGKHEEDRMILEYANLAHRVGFVFSFYGGIIAHRFGGATIIGIGVALTAFINIMTPFIGYLSLTNLILIKFTDGLLQAFAYTGMADIWARWYPAEERSKIVAFVLTGSYFCFLYQEHLSKLIVQQCGWRATFSICGTAAAIWSIIWLLIVRSDPGKDETLSDDEKEVLAPRLKYVDTTRSAITASEWKQILRSVPVWILCLATFVHKAGGIVTHDYLPKYEFSSPYRFTDEELEKKLPTVINIFMVTYLLVAGYLADYGRETKFTPTKIHKIFICTAFSAGALLLIAYAIVPQLLNIVTFFGLYDLFRSFAETALYVNTIDLSPKYASFISGFQLSFLALGELLRWQLMNCGHANLQIANFVFTSISVLYLFGAILYYYRGSGELQPWNTTRVEVHELKRSENDTAV